MPQFSSQRRQTIGASLDREEIRLRLRAAGSCSDGDPERASVQGIPAAVLVGLLEWPEGLRVILTERTAHLKNHAAQIAFPGGRIERDDAGPAAAALREAYEEIGLAADKVDLLGCLTPHLTVTGFLVYPFVGWIEAPVEFTPDPHEVAEVFTVPLDFVLDPANRVWETKYLDGALRDYYVLPYPGHRIWGATAGMLVSLARVLAG